MNPITRLLAWRFIRRRFPMGESKTLQEKFDSLAANYHRLEVEVARYRVANMQPPVAYAIFAKMDGKWVLQWPVCDSMEQAEKELKMYAPGFEPMKIVPLKASQL